MGKLEEREEKARAELEDCKLELKSLKTHYEKELESLKICYEKELEVSQAEIVYHKTQQTVWNGALFQE